MNKEEMLSLRNWAIVGATGKTNRFGYKIWKLMREKGYTVYGVNPNYKEIEGIKVFESIKAIGKPIDAVNMIIGIRQVPAILEEAKELGIRNIFFQPGSFNEEIVRLAEEMGFAFIVDDCIYKSLNEKEYEIRV